MTKRLYYHDPYMDECDAVVTDCIAIDGGYEVSVDQTVFSQKAEVSRRTRGL